MMKRAQVQRAREFQALHAGEAAFLMPNAWDAGSAILLAQAGVEAIGTTSAGIAFSRGLADYDNSLSRDDNMAAIAQICKAFDLPVSGDTESGYGPHLRDVEENMAQAIKTGAVGASIEDFSGNPNTGLYDIEEAVDRVSAAVAAIEASGIPIVLTARAECFSCWP